MSNELSNDRKVLIARWSSSKIYVLPKNLDIDDTSIVRDYEVRRGRLHIYYKNGDKLIITATYEDGDDYDTGDMEVEDADDHDIDCDDAPANEFIPAPAPTFAVAAQVPAPAPFQPPVQRIVVKKVTINNVLYLVRIDNGNVYDFNTREEIGMNYNHITGETTTYEVHDIEVEDDE